MLLGSAVLSIVMGILVYFVGQERRVKQWFLLLCVAAASLTFGLWIEVNVPQLSFAAARAEYDQRPINSDLWAHIRTNIVRPVVVRACCRIGCRGGGR